MIYAIKYLQKTILSAVFLASLLVQTGELFAQTSSKNSYSYNIERNNGESKIRIKNDKNDFQIEYKGEIKISDDDKNIIAISPGGFIEIKKSSFGNKRRIIIESDGNGRLDRRFYIGRSEKDYNSEGRAWLAQILPEVVRTTTIGAESRVARFYKKGGANAVINEIEAMKSDYVQSTYFKLLLKNNLSNSELVSVINTAGEVIGSDHYLTEILKANQSAFLANSQTISAYINAAKSIGSDHYTTEVLKKVISDNSINDSQLSDLLVISKNVSSDHYVTQILKEVMKKRNLNSQNVKQIISLSKDIQSDHYKKEVLDRVISSSNMSSDAYDALLGTMNDIQSDHYMSEVINKLIARDLNMSTGALNKLLNLVKTNISSDHYASNIYRGLSKQNLSEAQLISALNAMSSIRSDHSLSTALKAFAPVVRKSSEKVKNAYRTAAKSINSNTYYGSALKAIN